MLKVGWPPVIMALLVFAALFSAYWVGLRIGRSQCPAPPAAKYDLDSLQEASAMWEERARRHGEATASLLNTLDSLQRARPTPTQATEDAERYLDGAPVDRLIDILEQRPE